MPFAKKLLVVLVIGPILVAVAAVGSCEARKAYFDRQVEKMCEADAGVAVFEKVVVSRQEYLRLGGSHGEIPVPEERSAAPDYPFVSNSTRTVLRSGNPEVTRTEALIKRRSDGKVLARYVSYARVGGDVPTFAHPSYKMCDLPGGSVSQRVFAVEEAAR